MKKIAIIGAGTWGLAVANVLASNGHAVTLYTRDNKKAKALKRKRTHDNLPGFILDKKIDVTSDLEDAAKEKDIIVFAVPSVSFRKVVRSIVKIVKGTEYFVTLTKGLEDKTLYTMSEIIEDELRIKGIKSNKVAALSGPTHAEEVALFMPTMCVSASRSKKIAKFIQDTFMNINFRVYTNNDIKGVEICAAFKNVIAIASGMLTGLGYGDNIKAGLMTRGLAEMVRVGKALGCKKDTFYGLAGVGDMIVTCTSTNSRNYRFGKLIGENCSADKALKKIGMVVEGVNLIPKAMEIRKKYKLDLPVSTALNEIIYNKKDPRRILNLLMLRSKKAE